MGSVRMLAAALAVAGLLGGVAVVEGGPGAGRGAADAGSRVAAQETARGGPFRPDPAIDSLRLLLDGERLAELRARASASDEPRAWYALGAALLVTGDWEGSVEPLRLALARASDEAVRADALYDLGLARALAGRPAGEGERDDTAAVRLSPEERTAALRAARDAFREVLREDPGAEDARWNLELVERWLERPELAGGGGGGGAGAGGGGGGGAGGPAERGAQGPSLTPEEAERLLEAAGRQEQGLQERRLERSRARDPAVPRNW